MDKRKLAAAMAAVTALIRTEEEAFAYSAQQEVAASSQQQVSGPNNLWGIMGRQTCMQASSMMQLRMFK